jgi:uncharacterized protein
MVIDIHTHVAELRSPDRLVDLLPVTFEDLIRRLDEEGIDRAVVLPEGLSPESTTFPALFSPGQDMISVIGEVRRHQDRLIPFGNLDPRLAGAGNRDPRKKGNSAATDYSWALERFVELGCVGIGEVTANIPFDDPRMVNMVRQCGERDLPVLFHGTGTGPGYYGLTDQVGSPCLERLLRQAPDAVLIGHGPGFWSEVEGDLTSEMKADYIQGPIRREGSLPRLLRTYGNLYADISAMSGLRAISQDRAFGVRFLNEFQGRILFGTDVAFGGEAGRMPHLEYLRELERSGEIGREVLEKIVSGNTRRILKRLVL